MSDPVVRPLVGADLPRAAELHRADLHVGLFPLLGERFLVRYLDTFRAGPQAVALAVELDGVFAGFLVGTTGAGHSQWVLRHSWRDLLPAAVLGLARHPRALSLFVRTRLRRYGSAATKVVVARARPDRRPAVGTVRRAAPPAVLMHVAVEPQARGRGAAGALVDAFEQAAAQRGCVVARLVSAEGNGPAARLYRSRGWTPVRLRRSGRAAAWLYEKRLVA